MNCDLLILTLRIVLGICFILHGGQKVFGWFKGSGLEGWSKYLETFKIPKNLAKMIAWFELLAGFFLIFGLFSRLISVGLIAFMIGAIYLVHLKKGYFTQDGGFEYQLTLTILLILLVLNGPGKYSLNKL